MNEQSPPKKLTRSRDDRYVGGVAAGIGEHFNIDPIFVRIGFVASLALGGLGLLAYLVLLAVMPVEGDPAEPLPPIEPKRRNLMIGLAVAVGIVGIAVADSGDFAGWLFGFWPGTVFGILFWVAAAGVVFWLLASGKFDRSAQKEPGLSKPVIDTEPPAPTPGEPSTEVVTYAESPSQLSTEVMETRQMPQGEADPAAATQSDSARGSGESAGNAAPAPVRDDGPSTIGKIMVWFAIGVSALIVFSTLFVVSAGTTALFGGVPMAALVILLGGAMVFAGLRGRRQISLWLLTAAIAVTLPMAAVSIADLRVEGSYGDLNETPLSVLDIPEDGYKMAAGNMTIDLRRFDFPANHEQPLDVESGMGLTSIIVPDDVCVTGVVTGKAGIANIRGRQSNGIDIRQSAPGPSGWKPGVRNRGNLLMLDADFKLGAFEVVDSTQWRADGSGGSFEDNDLEADDRATAAARDRASAACESRPAPLEKRQKDPVRP
ncbi:MAG TPA: PspC domain-containing protein [Solirubrobacterales bacterium]|nr:PspC domain-containing protein [Solirubrobacterales bacterium]